MLTWKMLTILERVDSACTAMKKMKNEREGCSPSSLVQKAAA
jgi:hypothetical protein